MKTMALKKGAVQPGWAASLSSSERAQLKKLLKTVEAVKNGDFSVRFPTGEGIVNKIGEHFNAIVELNENMTEEFVRVSNLVGQEGKKAERVSLGRVKGGWATSVNAINALIGDLVQPINEVARVITAVAQGDLSQKMFMEIEHRPVKGELYRIGTTVNGMVDQLNSFAAEVTRVAREVGTEGKLGGQAKVPGVAGIWKDLTDNVNFMASNLTKQVRGIIKVVTAVANGDLSQKFVLEAKGEVAALAETINNMTDTLKTFADQVTTVAREVGIEGKLGGQAKVPGASGIWKDLTGNVNQLAGNLTTQVRAIAEVSTAVTTGDLTRFITVQAQGEVNALKNNINQMISNLKDTTRKNKEQDWLKTNLAKFSSMMQGQRSITAVAQLIMSELTPLVDAQHGTFFMLEKSSDEPVLNLVASYAYTPKGGLSTRCRLKEGLVGQCAFEKTKILLTDVPKNYIRISSSLSSASPQNVLVLPVLFEGEVKAVLELASFKPFSQNHMNFLDQLTDSIGVVLNVISSNMTTEELLQKLKKSNVELENQAKELNEKAKLLELKNREVELASRSLEEKAEQLSLISKYKSEFLANMSHELRTPLNSLLILSKMLSENKEGNLLPEQIKFAKTIYESGNDLMSLINEILDLSRVEAGKMTISAKKTLLKDVEEYLEQNFRPIAENKGLQFTISMSPQVPENMMTDTKRLHQILKNLLSNAFKFTEQGQVVLTIDVVTKDQQFKLDSLNQNRPVILFSVKDTGIGIPQDKQKLIFEAFQQADGTTNRKYGGTGLGLTISREIARLLGGQIDVESSPGTGSTFTLYLPQNYRGTEAALNESAAKQDRVIPALPANADFSGKTVLVVDDDQRNILAITAALEARKMAVFSATNGKTGLEILWENPNIDLVLMDIMMPEMDGLAAIQVIRKQSQFKTLPILSLTAKAMKGDREKCLEAGASDYITKPVDPDGLLSLIYLWLKKSFHGTKSKVQYSLS